MPPEWRNLVERVHQSRHLAMMAMTGGGSSSVADLLAVPGASRTLLEAIVPYAPSALGEWLGRTPEHFCSEATALAMASVAYRRAVHLVSTQPEAAESLIGLGCTAALVSDRPKRGEHRAFVASQTATATTISTLVLVKGKRDRAGEEACVGRMVLEILALSCGLKDIPSLDLFPNENRQLETHVADPRLAAVWKGQSTLVWSLPDGTLQPSPPVPVRGLLCGAFDPLHHGHAALRSAAEQRLSGAVAYEMSISNVDKAPLDYLTIARRRSQFHDQPLAMTNAPTFAEKAVLFPGMAFVVGVDTAERIVQPRYYGDRPERMRDALNALRNAGCTFLVAGRSIDGKYCQLQDLAIPAEYADLFDPLPEDAFRADISSTELRKGSGASED